MKRMKATTPMATTRRRSRRPAVIMEIQSRQTSRDSCCANQTAVPAMALMPPVPARRPMRGMFPRDCRPRSRRRRSGLAAQLFERAFSDELAVSDDADAIGHAFRHFEDMRGQDDGAAGTRALAQ